MATTNTSVRWLRRAVLCISAAATLAGCVVYGPPPGPVYRPYYGAYYYGPPVVVGVAPRWR
jgi:hypothetical protein